MGFRVDIQSAPVRQGTVGAPSSWSGASASVVTASGVYDGSISKTYAFTVVDAGTIDTTATISIDWDDGEGNTGRLNLGASRYTGGNDVTVSDGISVAFSAAAVAAADTFTLAVTAANRVSGNPIVVSGAPSASNVTSTSIEQYRRGDNDVVTSTFDGRERRIKRSTTGQLSLLTDWLDDANRKKILNMHADRTLVCVGENYDENTVFLLHGGGLLPFIGERSAFTRATQATYPDPDTGLLRAVASGDVRVVSGQAGRALLLEQAATNLFAYSAHATPSSFWTVSGSSSATLSWDTTVKGPYDPTDPYWNAAHLDGVAKLAFPAGGTYPSDPGIDANDAAVSATTRIAGSIYVRGFGEIEIRLRTGVVSVNTTKDTKTIQLTSEWQRVRLNGITGVGDTKADLQILGNEQGVCYFTGWQLEQSTLASALIQTAGSTATRNLDDQTFSQAIPVESGSFGMWFYWPESSASGLTYTLIEATGVSGSERFRLEYADAAGTWYFYQDTSTPGLGAGLATGTVITRGQWHHVAVTWKESSTTDGTMDRVLYVNGTALSWTLGGSSTGWEPFFGTGFNIAKSAGGSSESTNGFRLEELRIDRVAWSADQVMDQYNRLTSDDWLHVHRPHAGRKYRIADTRDRWLSNAIPGKVIMNLALEEADREDDSVVVPA